MRRCLLLLMGLCVPLMLGMGSQGGAPSDRIPVPEKKFMATFIDSMDVTTSCTDVSIEGGVFIQGRIGEGTYTVSFENIQEIVFRLSAESLYGQIRTRDGGSIEIVVDKNRKAYGRTKFGAFHIRLNDLKKMILFPGPAEKEALKKSAPGR